MTSKAEDIVAAEAATSPAMPAAGCRRKKAPDGGYGWIVLVVAFLISFIMDGCMYSFGIILNEIKNYFGVRQDIANLVQSLNVGFLFLSGPVSAGLAKQFGCRPVIMVAALVTASVNVVTAFLPSIILVQLIYGVVGGIGFGCTYLTIFIILVDYFDKKLGIANGLTMAGSGFGAFAFAPFAKFLISQYDWKISMVYLGCIMMQCCVLGALLRPLVSSKERSEIEMMEMKSRNEAAEAGPLPFHERIAFVRIMKGIVKDTFNIKLLFHNFPFLLLALCNFFIFLGYFVPFIYIPIRAGELGIVHYAWIISIIGIVNIPARIAFGFITDRRIISSVNMNTLCTITATVCLYLFYPLTHFWMHSIFATVYAIAIAGTNCLATTYIRDAVGSEKFGNANGILNIFRGIGCFIGPFIAGAISEKTGSSLHAFTFAASCFIIAFLMSLTVSIYTFVKQRITARKRKEAEEPES